jgi:THO complex subunit 1
MLAGNTPASEVDGEGIKADFESPEVQMDADATGTGNISRGGTPTPDEHHKQSFDTDVAQEAGQLE